MRTYGLAPQHVWPLALQDLLRNRDDPIDALLACYGPLGLWARIRAKLGSLTADSADSRNDG